MNLKLLVKMNCLQLLFKKGRADLATGKKKRNPISREQALESLRLVEPQTWAREEGKMHIHQQQSRPQIRAKPQAVKGSSSIQTLKPRLIDQVMWNSLENKVQELTTMEGKLGMFMNLKRSNSEFEVWTAEKYVPC